MSACVDKVALSGHDMCLPVSQRSGANNRWQMFAAPVMNSCSPEYVEKRAQLVYNSNYCFSTVPR